MAGWSLNPPHDAWPPNRTGTPGPITGSGVCAFAPRWICWRSVGPLPEGDVVDLGCGGGSVGPALGQLRRHLIGVDQSPAMLAQARLTGGYDDLLEMDLAAWRPEAPPR